RQLRHHRSRPGGERDAPARRPAGRVCVGMMPTVVVTGVTSFVGLHLARSYADRGDHVVAVTRRLRSSYEGIRAARLRELEGRVEFVQSDVTDAQAVVRLVKTSTPSLWLHHAGFAEAYGS